MKTLVGICNIVMFSLLLMSCTNSKSLGQNNRLTPTTISLLPSKTPVLKAPTDTPVPTSTLQAVLKVEQANKLVIQLLRGNINCPLPCWWGITPSVTTSQDVKSFLNSFSMIATTSSSHGDDGAVWLNVPNGNGLLDLAIEYNGTNGVVNRLIIGISQVVQDETGNYEEEFGNPAFLEVTKSLALSEILKLYGPPEDVRIATYSLQPLGMPVIFDIQLFYPKKGFVIAYKSLMEFSTNQYIKGCPSKSNIVMSLWETGKFSSVDEVPQVFRKSISSLPLSSYLPIDKASSMSIQGFYETFKDDDGTLCLETPSELWPMPGQ